MPSDKTTVPAPCSAPTGRSRPKGILTRSIASGPIIPRKRTPRNRIAIPYMVKGLIHQFIKRVRNTGFPLFPALMTDPKSIFTIMGYIIKNRHIAMGIEITGAPLTLIAIPSSVLARSGATLPSTIPPTIQSPTQTVRYLSNMLVIFRSLAGYASSSIAISLFQSSKYLPLERTHLTPQLNRPHEFRQGVTYESFYKVIIHNMALPIPYCMGTKISV